MSNTGAIIARADIDISPEGLTLSLVGIDNDLAELIKRAKLFEVILCEQRNLDSADIQIRSVKALDFIDRIMPLEEE